MTAKEDMYALSEASQNMTEQRIYQVTGSAEKALQVCLPTCS